MLLNFRVALGEAQQFLPTPQRRLKLLFHGIDCPVLTDVHARNRFEVAQATAEAFV
jgi:hypothetical protein